MKNPKLSITYGQFGSQYVAARGPITSPNWGRSVYLTRTLRSRSGCAFATQNLGLPWDYLYMTSIIDFWVSYPLPSGCQSSSQYGYSQIFIAGYNWRCSPQLMTKQALMNQPFIAGIPNHRMIVQICLKHVGRIYKYIYIHHTIIHINYNQSDWPTKKSRMLCIFLYHETPHFHLLGSTGFKPSIVWRIWWVHPISISRKNCWLPSNPPFISIYEHFPLKP
jgi:hypothetical protein